MRRIAVERSESPYEALEILTIGLRQGHLIELLFDDCTVPMENAGRNGRCRARIDAHITSTGR